MKASSYDIKWKLLYLLQSAEEPRQPFDFAFHGRDYVHDLGVL